MEQVSVLDVKKTFVLANKLKESSEKFSRGEIDEEKLLETYGYLTRIYADLTELEVNEFLTDARIERYKSLSWQNGFFSLIEMGNWPEAQEIPPELTQNALPDTAVHLRNYSINDKIYDTYNFSDERKKNIESLINLISNVQENPLLYRLPLILVPGDLIRGEDYKAWVMENHRHYVKHQISLHGIDDGNVRALALAFLNNEEAYCYIGHKN